MKRQLYILGMVFFVLLLSSCGGPLGQATEYTGANSVTANPDGSFSYTFSVSVTQPSILFHTVQLGVKEADGSVATKAQISLEGGKVSSIHPDWRIGTLTATVTSFEITPGTDNKIYMRARQCDPDPQAGWVCTWVTDTFEVVKPASGSSIDQGSTGDEWGIAPAGGGSSGAGGSGVECYDPAQCPYEGPCVVQTCVNNKCGSEPQRDGFPCSIGSKGATCHNSQCIAPSLAEECSNYAHAKAAKYMCSIPLGYRCIGVNDGDTIDVTGRCDNVCNSAADCPIINAQVSQECGEVMLKWRLTKEQKPCWTPDEYTTVDNWACIQNKCVRKCDPDDTSYKSDCGNVISNPNEDWTCVRDARGTGFGGLCVNKYPWQVLHPTPSSLQQLLPSSGGSVTNGYVGTGRGENNIQETPSELKPSGPKCLGDVCTTPNTKRCSPVSPYVVQQCVSSTAGCYEWKELHNCKTVCTSPASCSAELCTSKTNNNWACRGQPVDSRSCTDSDGGREYYTLGVTIGSDGKEYRDSCFTPGSMGYTPGKLSEFYCNPDIEGGVGADYYTCPNGCADGVCLRG